jgi:hypothetical protein
MQWENVDLDDFEDDLDEDFLPDETEWQELEDEDFDDDYDEEFDEFND